MAKRSVRRARARQQQQQQASSRPAPTPSGGRRPAGFWLGALVATAVLVPLAIVAVILVGGGEETQTAEPAADPVADVEDTAARLRRESAARDKEQIAQLTERARAMVEDFTPVVAGLGRTLPPGKDRIGPLADRADVADWRRRVNEADAYFEETVSGETATNVARNALSNAVDALLEAVRTYELALRQPSARAPLLELAREQRDLAARIWSTASIQLDVINIDAGYGHQHVVFPSAGAGAVPPDSLPEGTGAEPPGDR